MEMLDWLEHLVAPLNTVVFILGNDHVSWAEILGFVTGATGVWLTVKCHIANFPIGIANSAFFLILFATSRLWADSSLQVLYVVLGFVGWWQWLHGGPKRSRLVVGRTPRWFFAAAGLSSSAGHGVSPSCSERSTTSHRSGMRSPPASPW